MSDITDRLRDKAPWVEMEHYPSIAKQMLEAAAEIDRLEVEVIRLSSRWVCEICGRESAPASPTYGEGIELICWPCYVERNESRGLDALGHPLVTGDTDE